jgi:mRNA interferase YafQ
MRTIKRSNVFKKDFKRVKSNPKHAKVLDERLRDVLTLLCQDHPLPEAFRDHELIGNWRGFRECHLKPDLLLIYQQTSDGLTLQLARLGSHSELFR